MNYLRNKFLKCLYHKKNILCQSIRSHYIDMRPEQYHTEYISELNHILKIMSPLIWSFLDSSIKEYNTYDYDILLDYFNNLFPLSSVENRRMLKNVIKSLATTLFLDIQYVQLFYNYFINILGSQLLLMIK